MPTTDTDIQTTWGLFECERGNRWSQTTRYGSEDKDGQLCYFSGCQQDHTIKLVSTTTDAPYDWFRSVNR